MDILLISTPAQHSSSPALIQSEPATLQTWIATLPVKDVLDTVKQLHAAVVAFNEVEQGDGERLKLLEVYYQGFQSILYFYDELRLRQLPIAATAKKSLAEDIMWLYLELAQGYKIIVKHSFELGLDPATDQYLLRAMYRALELISFALLYAFRSGVAIPPLAFLEVYQLYYHAKRFSAHTLKIRFLKGHQEMRSMDRLFKQLMLLLIAKQTPIAASKLHELYLYFEPFAAQVTIFGGNNTDPSPNCYLIDVMSDIPPILLNTVHSSLTEPTQLFLSIRPALLAIRQWSEKLSRQPDAVIYEEEISLLASFLVNLEPVAITIAIASGKGISVE